MRQNKNNLVRSSLVVVFAAIALFCAPSLTRAFSLPAECAAETLSATADGDSDGLTDREETCRYFTDPAGADTDGDGHPDGTEVAASFSPRHREEKRLIDVDSDEDYLNDAWELALGTGLMDPDSDGDLYLDGTEVAASFDPLDRAPVKLEKTISVSTKDLRLTYAMGGTVLGVIPVSTGKPRTPTPTGDFTIMAKIPTKYYAGPTWDYPNTKWNLLFTRQRGWGYYIHGAYWHDNFGKAPVSGGCVNVRYEDMEALYWWAQDGTRVSIQ